MVSGGVLNSDLAQFYIRRNAATYRGNYLRYKSEYVGDIPIRTRTMTT
ncbi:hypothetical protein D8S78_12490 [Natrialba swarupiae]|nr:hypothetical protein [Natrialba swarupiae]